MHVNRVGVLACLALFASPALRAQTPPARTSNEAPPSLAGGGGRCRVERVAGEWTASCG